MSDLLALTSLATIVLSISIIVINFKLAKLLHCLENPEDCPPQDSSKEETTP